MSNKRKPAAESPVDPGPCSVEDMYVALRESVRLLSTLAGLLNQYDGGRRIKFATPEAWIAGLREAGTL